MIAFDDFSANFLMPRSILYDPGPGTLSRLRLLAFPLESRAEGAGAHVPPKTRGRIKLSIGVLLCGVIFWATAGSKSIGSSPSPLNKLALPPGVGAPVLGVSIPLLVLNAGDAWFS